MKKKLPGNYLYIYFKQKLNGISNIHFKNETIYDTICNNIKIIKYPGVNLMKNVQDIYMENSVLLNNTGEEI